MGDEEDGEGAGGAGDDDGAGHAEVAMAGKLN